MDSPGSLKKDEVLMLDHNNSGLPVFKKKVRVCSDHSFCYEFDMRENDIYFVNLCLKDSLGG